MTARPRTAFLHIGAPKTGTTAIQSAFAAARGTLADHGLHYLEGDQNHSERLALSFWDVDDARRLACLRQAPDAPFDQATLLDTLADEIETNVPNDVVFSAEGLCDFRPDEVARLFDFFSEWFDQITLIAYARDPESWMHSAGQQAIKWSGECLEDVFSSPRLPRYRARMSPWLKAVGQENFVLRHYSGGTFDAVADFCQVIGIPHDTIPRQDARANTALTQTGAVALSALNLTSPPFVEFRHNPCRAYAVVDRCRFPGPRFLLPRETIEAAAIDLDDDRAWLNRLLGTDAFAAGPLPSAVREDWFGSDRLQIEDLGRDTAETCRSAQNEYALLCLLRAMKFVATRERAVALLATAAKFATDRWSMGQIAEMAVQLNHTDRQEFFAKQRLMRRIEDPEPSDPPLQVGNPFDRFWAGDGPHTQAALAG